MSSSSSPRSKRSRRRSGSDDESSDSGSEDVRRSRSGGSGHGGRSPAVSPRTGASGGRADLSSSAGSAADSDDEVGPKAVRKRPKIVQRRGAAAGPARAGARPPDPAAGALTAAVATDQGRIRRIDLVGRTPSPLDSGMGDHTTAWSAVCDSEVARIHGMTRPAAVVALRAALDADTAWTADAASAENRLLTRLGPGARAARLDLLETTADTVRRLLTRPDPTWEDVGAAVAGRLAYRNYLPFATVPSDANRGSFGGTEGTHRQALLGHERGDAPLGAADLRQHLWGMFDAEAALRSSGALDLVFGSADTVTAQIATLQGLRAELDTALADQLRSGSTAARDRLADIHRRATAVATEAGATLLRLEDAGVVAAAAGPILRIAQARLAAPDTERAGTRTVKIPVMRAELSTLGTEADTRMQALATRIADAQPAAADTLAALVHEHQRTTALAYGRSVRGAALPTDLTPQAVAHLGAEIERIRRARNPVPPARPAAAQALTDAVDARHRTYAAPVPKTDGTWSADAVVTRLAVSWDPDREPPLQVAGRTAPPPAFGGMGAHTSAWVREVMAAESLVRGAASAEDAVRTVRDEVRRDLASPIMELDRVLSIEQLAAGQMSRVLEAAHRVFTTPAGAVADTAGAYLAFRNLLPYATVDVADTRGKGESRTASESETFDAAAIRQGAGLVVDELNDRPDEVRDARTAAADDLRALMGGLAAVGDPDAARALDAAAAASITRLQATDPDRPDRLVQIVVDLRRAEHRRVYALGQGLARH